MTTWTDERLKRLFGRYNNQYFQGRLPNYSVMVSDLRRGGCCIRSKRQILINLNIARSDHDVRAILIHEMAHAATLEGHGKPWQREMKRLQEQGAPTVAWDFNGPGFGWDDIRAEFCDAGFAKVSWRSALRQITWINGLADKFGNMDLAPRDINSFRAAFAKGRREARMLDRNRIQFLQRHGITCADSPPAVPSDLAAIAELARHKT